MAATGAKRQQLALQLGASGAFTPLRTERLLLRPLRPEDAEAVHRLVNDWEVVRMLSQLPFPYPRDLADKWIASTLEQIERGSGYHLAITGQENGEEMLIGCIGLRLDIKPRVGTSATGSAGPIGAKASRPRRPPGHPGRGAPNPTPTRQERR